MDSTGYSNKSDTHQELILKNEDCMRGYSYVGKQVRNDVTGGVIEKCSKCNTRILIKDVRKWRLAGAGLICNICAGVKPGRVVTNDNYEVLKVKSNGSVVLPERLKKEGGNRDELD